jgi:hypothetical protein
MPKAKQEIKTYTIQVVARIEVTATYEIEGYSEKDAISRAEDQMEMNLECCDSTAEEFDYSIEDFDSEIVEEE